MPSQALRSLERELQEHLGKAVATQVMEGMALPPSVSLRFNPKKPVAAPTDAKTVPWHPNGFLLPERPVFALDPLFHAGAYYVQDSSSMILAKVLEALPLQEDPLCLDACAAPGGKSTILLDALNGKGFLIANEIDEKRQRILQENLLKWGHTNYGVTSEPIERFEDELRFQMILVDAPCSGEGMFRKDAFAQAQWNTKLINQCALTQRTILEDATALLEEEGYLIYATCTMNPKENEEQLIRLLETDDYVVVTPELTFDEHLIKVDYKGEILGYYLLPGISTGEGLFIAALKKVGPTKALRKKRKKKQKRGSTKQTETVSLDPLQAFDLSLDADIQGVFFGETVHLVSGSDILDCANINFRMVGQPAFKIKGKSVIPEHGLAMMECMHSSITLNRNQALAYIRKEVLSLTPEIGLGWHVVAYEGRHLGWVKVVDGRTNNYYPGWLRLRM